MRRLMIAAVALASLGLAAYAVWRPATPAPGADPAYACTTCDARQAARKRLSDYLQSQPD